METTMLKLSAATMIALLGLGCGGRAIDVTDQDRGGGSNGGKGSASGPEVSTSPNLPSEPPGEAGAPDVAAAGAHVTGHGGSSAGGSKGIGGSKSAGGAGRAGHASGDAGEAGAGGCAGDPGEAGHAGDSAGTGGSAGDASGGASASGGSGVGGSAGSGGFAPAPKCVPGLTFAPSTPLITDTFGSVAIPGALYHYTAPGLTPAVAEILPSSSGSFGGVHIKAEPGLATDPANQWFGVGVPLYGCVDATAYRGVQFTITGDLGNCSMTFSLVTSVNNSDSFVGSCQSSLCLAAASEPLTVGTTVVFFGDMTGGVPEANVNPATLNDLQWHFTLPVGDGVPECVADFTITNMSFVN